MPASEDIQATYRELADLDSASGDVRRNRGRRFERLLHNLLSESGLEPRTSFRPAGEELDGSFALDGRVYLLEAKWHAHPLPASSVYAFRGKVEGKLTGTIGVFVSMSGFSSEAVDALTFGKHLNVVLVDGDDISASVEGDLSIGQILRQKLRVAAEDGNIYFRRDAAFEVARESRPAAIRIVSEGRNDALLLQQLARRLSPDAEVISVAAGGKLATASLANALVAASNSRCLVVVDGDGDVSGSLSAIQQQLGAPSQVRIIVTNPTIDHWLQSEHLGRLSREPRPQVESAARRVDLQELRQKADGFADFEDALAWVAEPS